MHKITSRDIRKFVAGALALAGFRALISIPYFLTISGGSSRIGGALLVGLFASLDLLIGIGMFLGRWSALFWAQVYLCLIVISGCTVIPVLWCFSTAKAGRLALRSAPEILMAAVLLGLIFWSSSEKFRYERDA
jgi:hypothetical protein